MLRLLSVVPLVVVIMAGHHIAAFALFSVMALSDAVDGAVARMVSRQSSFGAALDPVADKVLLTGAFIALWWVGLVPGWFIMLLGVRDATIVASTIALFLMTRELRIAPLAIGKISTAMQLFLVGVILSDKAFEWPMSSLVDIGFPIVSTVAVLSLLLYAIAAWRGVVPAKIRRPA
ncbi:MAG: CDP-alcohol phosphatidyltransferase family protein [Geminicoccaceae bacterium]|nr:CDP-alcohol phosphatidyltransferase family protein [Geminicoccaceae bacterium]MCB9942682.1 CDP-alcohol phosphatidyltransferase family protein [Geminicoccaceae bacterium]